MRIEGNLKKESFSATHSQNQHTEQCRGKEVETGGNWGKFQKEKIQFTHEKYDEPDPSNRYWKFQAHNMNTLWKFYDSCSVHHISTQYGVDAFMLAEKEYPLRAGVLDVMLSSKLRFEERIEVVDDLIQRIYDQNRRETIALRKK